MKKFDIYFHKSHGYKAVKKGFSWPGLFLTWVWAFYYRLWGYALGYLAVSLFLIPFMGIFYSEKNIGGVLLLAIFQIGFILFFGEKGNEWRRKALEEEEYSFIKTMSAETPESALSAVMKQKSAIKL